MRFLLITFVFAIALVANAQTDRHGQSNGTVTELPPPRVFHDPQPLTETESSAARISTDAEILRIEAEYQRQLDNLLAGSDRPSPAEYNRIYDTVRRIKLDRELAILQHLRSRAQLRNDEAAVQQIESLIETLTARPDLRRTQDRKSGGAK